MHVVRAKLNHFRNYDGCEFVPCAGINALIGDNGQGKTNLLEAVYLSCTGRSHRTHTDKELIKWDSENASVLVEATRRDGKHEVEIQLSSTQKRRVKLSGKLASRSGELMGHVTGVLFSPEDLKSVKEGPAERRRMLDMTLSQISPAYYYALQRYMRALKQRNEALRTGLSQTLDSWDEQLAVTGAEIMRHRQNYIDRLNAVAGQTYCEISDGRERFGATYRPSVTAGDDAESLREALYAARNNDLRRLTTSVGVHRDELLLTINDKEVRVFGSQGQQRTAALSLRLSELDVMHKEMGEWPVLMLDDVMSELDPTRRRQLLAKLSNLQVIVTCTDASDLAGAQIGSGFMVKGAELVPM